MFVEICLTLEKLLGSLYPKSVLNRISESDLIKTQKTNFKNSIVIVLLFWNLEKSLNLQSNLIFKIQWREFSC